MLRVTDTRPRAHHTLTGGRGGMRIADTALTAVNNHPYRGMISSYCARLERTVSLCGSRWTEMGSRVRAPAPAFSSLCILGSPCSRVQRVSY